MFRSVLEQRVAALGEAVQRVVADLDPDAVPASEAVRVFGQLDRIVRSATAGRTLLARRVDDSLEWKRKGYKSAAEFTAATSGRSLGAARAEMDTSNALRNLDQTRRGMIEGELSPEQGETIAGAARVNGAAEEGLIQAAGTSNLNELRDQAQRAKAAADPSPEDTYRRIRRERRATRYTDGEGARHLNLRGPVDEMAVLEAEIDRLTDQIFRARAKAGDFEERGAYAFDAAIELARRSAGTTVDGANGAHDADSGGQRRGPQHLALLRLDVEALWRGHVEGDELCEVTGLGPIPVGIARRLLGDAVLKLLITKGQAVAHVTSLTRGPTQAMRYALLWTSPTCTVEGCSRTIVEHDHAWGTEYKDTRHTRLEETDRICTTHHDLHTYQGWALVPGAGKRPMVPPDDPRHPANTKKPPGGRPPGKPPPAVADATSHDVWDRTQNARERAEPPHQSGLFGSDAA